MSFRNSLQPASFRNVPFFVSGADTAVGRRVVVHEFPLREVSFAEDMGRKSSEFTVEGYLIGDNYIDQMKRLMAALMTSGAGKLVHPSLGELSVVLVQPGRMREQFIERGGMVMFSLQFIEAGDDAQPSVTTDTQQNVEDAADAAYDYVAEWQAKRFSVVGAPGWSIASITDEIDRVTDAIAEVRRHLTLDMSALTSLTHSAALFKVNLVGLLNKPAELANALISQVRSLTDLFNFNAPEGYSSFTAARYAKAPLNAMLGLATYGKAGTATARPDIPQNGTAIRTQQATNQAAVFELVRCSALIEACRAVVFQPFISFDDAVSVRDAVYDALDAEMLTASDTVYRALSALRVAVVADIGARGLDLTRLSTTTLTDSVPAIVLSHRLYGTTRYADELVDRNNVLNPLLMPGGVALEVRSV